MMSAQDMPTATDYAQADIHAATQSLEQMAAKLRVAEEKLALAEFKLTCMHFVAEAIDVPVSAVWLGQVTAKTIRDILEAESVDALKAKVSKGN